MRDLDPPLHLHPGRVPGLLVGVVDDNRDPDGLARVRVRYVSLAGEPLSAWARLCTPMAGRGRGLFLLPEVGDEVLLGHLHGNLEDPVVLGALWSARDTPPSDPAKEAHDQRIFVSRSGHRIEFHDGKGQERVVIEDASGKLRIELDSAASKLRVESAGDLHIQAKGELRIDAKTLRLSGSQSATIESPLQLELLSDGAATVRAGGTVTVKGSSVDLG